MKGHDMDKKKIAKTAGIALAASVAAGLAFAAPSLAAQPKADTSISAEQIGKKGHGKGKGNSSHVAPKANDVHVSQDITVSVPDDGGTYKLLVTQVSTPAATNSTTSNSQALGLDKKKTIVVDVTGTGSVTVTVPGLHPGSYTAVLVKVASTQDVTVTAPATTGTSN
jgi:hypothetical protein